MTYTPGLQGVVAARTRLSSVDGQAGELVISGFRAEELAERATFEETIHLLWHDRLPTARELTAFRSQLAAVRDLPDATRQLLRSAARERVPAMDALRMAAGTLDLRTGREPPGDTPLQEGVLAVARIPTIVASYHRLLEGEGPIDPHHGLSHVENFLYMLSGQRPTPARVRALETYFNTVVDHGLNASTFTARVIVSTESDIVSAVVGALGALKGPMHGGAPGPALDMVLAIGDPARAEAYMRAILDRGGRLMGFGHRVYKVRDPRAEILSRATEQLYAKDPGVDRALYGLAREVERVAVQLLDEYKPGRRLRTNVEFYTALLLHGLGLPSALFTPVFAVSRVGGWTAHCIEQLAENRIIRPESLYVGDRDRSWIPLEGR